MRLVQLTDLHLHADPLARSRAGVPYRQFLAVMDAIKQEKPDLVIVTGDISQDESAQAYALAVEQLNRLACPWHWLPGNHDQRPLMEAVHPLADALMLNEWRLLLLDTQVPGEPGGALGSDKLVALAAQLDRQLAPTIIAMHHPPVEVGAAWMDAISLEDKDAFWQLIGRYPQVKVVLFGHAHQAYAEEKALNGFSVSVYGSPATADQFLPHAEAFAVDEAARPGYRVLDIQGTGWHTRIERVTS
ncbi:phosphodiesterase [Halomonas sp. TBZ9]|uniref:Phosphodiesterase n=1 Tax=Vreelandella azerica TaxID=2732867 RepID=A0A7Y3TV76_9GAMM|nr:metallophosphoesterase [Halomonas azerica]NOG30861.1 phosphodiesterase [Halomonas azerica]